MEEWSDDVTWRLNVVTAFKQQTALLIVIYLQVPAIVVALPEYPLDTLYLSGLWSAMNAQRVGTKIHT